ncbi:MAG: trypsin-like peptidase domain-containing protein [bacterium]|nr:trypsin-like peptidase domain-containing protein [bacterium]
MEHLTKSQLVLLVLLVSFITSVVTGIVTVTLINQAPQPITQTVGKILEKTIERVVPGGIIDSKTANNNPAPIIITQDDLVVKLVKNTSPAVVSVIATKDLPVIEKYFVNPFGNDEFLKQFVPPDLLPQFSVPQYRQNGTEKKQVSSGTGFFVSSDGYIITNRHVVADKSADYSIILNDGRKLTAKVLSRDPVQDVAILKVEGTGFSIVPLGDSDNINVGQTVIAIGNVLGEFQNTVSLGVISGLNRSVSASSAGGEVEQLQEVIQTDAAINPGNSGGPLLNLKGEAIGINTAIAQEAENVGFALPINFAKKGLADTKEFGTIKYAFLGVRYVIINASVKQEKNLDVDYGILLSKSAQGGTAVMKDSPADKAGLKEGDIILEFGGIRVDQKNSFTRLLAGKRVGEKVSLKVLRGKEILNVIVTLDDRPEQL